jgi:hypothetical protein
MDEAGRYDEWHNQLWQVLELKPAGPRLAWFPNFWYLSTYREKEILVADLRLYQRQTDPLSIIIKMKNPLDNWFWFWLSGSH